MGSFGDSVRALLDTYGRCLKLLKGLRQAGQPSDAQSSLGSSIRSDRAKIRRVYSSGLEHRGATFEKGDAAARSSMRRLVRRLTSKLASVMQTFARQPVDYGSLESMVNSSRRDAIRTMTDLSSRVGSRSSLLSISTTKSHRSSASRRQGRKTHAKKKEEGKQSRRSSRSTQRSTQKHQARDKRVSMATMSSDSTKLGEVRRRQGSELGPQRVTYPLYMSHRADGERPYAGSESRRKWYSFWRNSS
ncbi:hypothetical protein B0I35DRAFT_482214 [Stachybotrys elegans]|uniref:Uncharacterized protein n=1 Tax=Stachybotrys elegans TaxID=80388 RepID=A0A8K0WNG4_9HYPO|nr:hypothetical protein B0I35DRAFT_482214 [Stachybotrys elegans]